MTYQTALNKWQNMQQAPGGSELFRCGLEKEGMRVQVGGQVAATPHPTEAGSPLTHSLITTDFAEALLEFVTPTFTQAEELLNCLDQVQKFTLAILQQRAEYIWPLSMPPAITDIEEIPIAQYGASYSGRVRHIYRRGLALRYGRRMQTIAGMHFNFSFTDAFLRLHQAITGERTQPDRLYFHLIRNYLRIAWITNYLLGASPALDSSFLAGDTPPAFLRSSGRRTLIHPHSTCLRMSSLGYVNKNTALMRRCFNSLDDYLTAFRHMLNQEHPDYAAHGIKNNKGEYHQLSTTMLQVENEYYASIRPKVTRSFNEKTIDVLSRRGVEYVEIRNLDINPFAPAGIDLPTIHFLQLLLTYCALKDSPRIDDNECSKLGELETNITMTNRGKKTHFAFEVCGNRMMLPDAASGLLDALRPLAERLDRGTDQQPYAQGLARMHDLVTETARLPSEQLAHRIQTQKQEHIELGMQLAREHAAYYAALPTDPAWHQRLGHATRQSRQTEQQLRSRHPQNDASDFDQYVRAYLRVAPAVAKKQA